MDIYQLATAFWHEQDPGENTPAKPTLVPSENEPKLNQPPSDTAIPTVFKEITPDRILCA